MNKSKLKKLRDELSVGHLQDPHYSTAPSYKERQDKLVVRLIDCLLADDTNPLYALKRIVDGRTEFFSWYKDSWTTELKSIAAFGTEEAASDKVFELGLELENVGVVEFPVHTELQSALVLFADHVKAAPKLSSNIEEAIEQCMAEISTPEFDEKVRQAGLSLRAHIGDRLPFKASEDAFELEADEDDDSAFDCIGDPTTALSLKQCWEYLRTGKYTQTPEQIAYWEELKKNPPVPLTARDEIRNYIAEHNLMKQMHADTSVVKTQSELQHIYNDENAGGLCDEEDAVDDLLNDPEPRVREYVEYLLAKNKREGTTISVLDLIYNVNDVREQLAAYDAEAGSGPTMSAGDVETVMSARAEFLKSKGIDYEDFKTQARERVALQMSQTHDWVIQDQDGWYVREPVSDFDKKPRWLNNLAYALRFATRNEADDYKVKNNMNHYTCLVVPVQKSTLSAKEQRWVNEFAQEGVRVVRSDDVPYVSVSGDVSGSASNVVNLNEPGVVVVRPLGTAPTGTGMFPPEVTLAITSMSSPMYILPNNYPISNTTITKQYVSEERYKQVHDDFLEAQQMISLLNTKVDELQEKLKEAQRKALKEKLKEAQRYKALTPSLARRPM